jgi:hypothetical protein
MEAPRRPAAAHRLHLDAAEELMRSLSLVLLVLSAISVAGCELAGDIFEVGVWAGVITVVLVIAIVGFIAAKLRG